MTRLRIKRNAKYENPASEEALVTNTYLEAPISKFEASVANIVLTFSGSLVTSISAPNTTDIRISRFIPLLQNEKYLEL